MIDGHGDWNFSGRPSGPVARTVSAGAHQALGNGGGFTRHARRGHVTSTWFVYPLVVVTSVFALGDLFLLATHAHT